MAVFALGDPHLSLGGDKGMDLRFPGWKDYVPKLEENWRRLVKDGDVVVIPGDVSWAMNLEDCGADFSFLDSLPGTKILGKGNHDYWWATMRKNRAYVEAQGFSTLNFLFNNAYDLGSMTVAGTRGWFFDAQETEDNAKIILREAGRLKTSIEAALAFGKTPTVFMHYPVVMDGKAVEPLLRVLKDYGIRRVYFGHIHGERTGRLLNYEAEGIVFSLVSADALNFCPKQIG